MSTDDVTEPDVTEPDVTEPVVDGEDDVVLPLPDGATVTKVAGGWHLVEHGSWQVSVGPDAHIMLPRSLDPTDVHEFVGAVLAAAVIGCDVREANEAAGAKDDRSLGEGPIVVRTGGVPAGAGRLIVSTGPNGASIGRPKGNS